MMECCNKLPNFFKRLLFSEVTFSSIGTVDTNNCTSWLDTNPHWIMGTDPQILEKVNIWAGIFRPNILWSFFIDGTLITEKYLQMLQNLIIPAITALYPGDRKPHTSSKMFSTG